MSIFIRKALGLRALLLVFSIYLFACGHPAQPVETAQLAKTALPVEASPPAQKWNESEIVEVFIGEKIDLAGTVAKIKAKDQTPYDFGIHLLKRGKTREAKRWFEAIGIETKELQYVYGLARVKWKTGDNHGALRDGYYIINNKPSKLIRARTLYLLGTINIDERRFDKVDEDLKGALDAYAELGKNGGQYLVLSQMAWASVAQEKYEEGQEYMGRALEQNEKAQAKGFPGFSLGFYHEVMAEIEFRQGNYPGALNKAEESEAAYRKWGQVLLADFSLTKIALLKLMSGDPERAGEIATQIWEKYNDRLDGGKHLAYNDITLMKLDQCSGDEINQQKRETAARAWANSSAGGKTLIELLEFVADRQNVPCPEWR